MKRLGLGTLGDLPAAIARPRYALGDLPVGIVHLGLGNFHRAHQAVYTDLTLDKQFGPWGIAAVSLRTRDAVDALVAQDGLYAFAAKEGSRMDLRVVGAIRQALFAPEAMAQVVASIAAPTTRIVTLTVTEKGYGYVPSTGDLDRANPDIARDLAHPAAPRTTLGVLAAALRLRRAAKAPVTLLSCDNLPSNGKTLQKLLGQFVAETDRDLARWIDANVAFPCSMVDRIVPTPTAADRADIGARLGVDDAASVVGEPFTQWVVEDRFLAGRPDWHAVGVEFVGDVEPYERMKLRLLNGAHSTLAYLGYLAGHPTIAAAANDDRLRAVARGVMAESAATLDGPAGVDLERYRESLIARFRNAALPHTTAQVAMDGSQKLPQRLLAPLRARLAAGREVRLLSLAVAGWMRFAMGKDERDQPIAVKDPLAPTLAAIAAAHAADLPRYVDALLAVGAIFGDDLPQRRVFRDTVLDWLTQLRRDGAVATAARAAGGLRPGA